MDKKITDNQDSVFIDYLEEVYPLMKKYQSQLSKDDRFIFDTLFLVTGLSRWKHEVKNGERRLSKMGYSILASYKRRLRRAGRMIDEMTPIPENKRPERNLESV